MTGAEFMTILKRIAGIGLGDDEVYDENFIGTEINRAYAEYEALLKDRDRIKQQYIDDFTKVDESNESKDDAEKEEEKEIKMEEFLNI